MSTLDPRREATFGTQLLLWIHSNRPDLVRPSGSIDWAKLAEGEGGVGGIPNVSYEVLRKAVTRERRPSARLIKAVAEHIGIPPSFFAEYRIAVDRRRLDPLTYGNDDDAVENAIRYRKEMTQSDWIENWDEPAADTSP